jgi:hypothetical protein
VSVVDDDIIESVFTDVPPGPGLAVLLATREPDRLDDFDLIEMARAARRLASWAASLEYGAIAELSARRKTQGERVGAWDSEVGEWVSDEVAAALTLSGGTAARRVVAAEQLTGTLPGTLRALAEGLIDAEKAKVIADGVCGTGPVMARWVEQRVLASAPTQTCAQLRHAVRAAVRDGDPDAHERRRKAAEEARRVELWDTDAGTGDLVGRDLPAMAAATAYNRINAIAHALKSDGDPRGIDQLRADVLLDLIHNRRPTPHTPDVPTPSAGHAAEIHRAPGHEAGLRPSIPPAAHPTAADINRGHAIAGSDGTPKHDDSAHHDQADGPVVAGAVAQALRHQLGGLTDRLTRDGRRRGGQAALVAEAARRIKEAVADLGSRWCVTDKPGIHGADTYRIPAAIRRTVQTRDATCRFPGCRRAAARCDIDHTLAHHKGGPTCPCNLAILCRRHHRLKQRPEWQITQIWPGVLLWIAPTGHWYLTTPPRE